MPRRVPLVSTAAAAAAAVGAVADLLWPRLCAACGAEADGDPAGPLCPACRLELAEFHARPWCGACGRPAPADGADGGVGGACPNCDGRGRGPVRRVARLSPYDGPAKALVRRAKYGGRWELATALGRLLAATPAARGLLTPDAVVVAVPLHPSRRRSRGFDQAALIAGPLAAAIGARPAEVLARARPTRPQAALSGAAERRGNVRDAFALLHPGPVAGRPVVLVDDVLTTGATVRAAARALAPAKPASVAAAVAAVAGAKRGGFDE